MKYLERMFDDFGERYENIEEFLEAVKIFEIAYPQGTIHDFLCEIALYTDSNFKNTKNSNSVTLMSIHTAKGLEYPVVFIMGLNDGTLPSTRMGVSDNLDEERRILYVAITRAKKHLFLSRKTGYSYKNEPLVISRFIKELGKNHIVNVAEQAYATNDQDMS
jgi:DNA helicase-2/ATP-dependent DNA helicase PcrA